MDEKISFIEETGGELGQMMRLAHHVHNRLHASLSEIGLSRGQPPILQILVQNGNISQRELADALGLSPATITVTLKRMEKAKLILRATDPLDQRVQRVEITAHGRELAAKTRELYRRVHAEFITCLSERERAAYREITEKMLDHLEAPSTPG